MRFNSQPQPSLFSIPVGDIEFDIHSRHELLPILMALKHLYVDEPDLLREILHLIEDDINPCSGKAIGRRAE